MFTKHVQLIASFTSVSRGEKGAVNRSQLFKPEKLFPKKVKVTTHQKTLGESFSPSRGN